MQNDYITMSFMDKLDHKVIFSGAYEFKPTGRFIFFKRWLWNSLFKLGCLDAHYKVDDTCRVHQIRFSKEDASHKIIDMARMQLAKSNMVPRKIYLGREQFNQIAMLPMPVGHPFHFEIKAYKPEFGWNNIPVEVIPWMDGVLVV